MDTWGQIWITSKLNSPNVQLLETNYTFLSLVDT